MELTRGPAIDFRQSLTDLTGRWRDHNP
ncbi:hypothetical protein NC652_001083 [Populus alba x Populus x berolinensis]|nr:hypothetical protein NC652_001083 [Populus alba x Populus x berolinensis]